MSGGTQLRAFFSYQSEKMIIYFPEFLLSETELKTVAFTVRRCGATLRQPLTTSFSFFPINIEKDNLLSKNNLPFYAWICFIFSNETKLGVEICHLTRSASKIRRKRGNGSVLMGTECLNTRFH